MFERCGDVSERESIECAVHVLVFLPKSYHALERPITLVIENIERIALFACFLRLFHYTFSEPRVEEWQAAARRLRSFGLVDVFDLRL